MDYQTANVWAKSALATWKAENHGQLMANGVDPKTVNSIQPGMKLNGQDLHQQYHDLINRQEAPTQDQLQYQDALNQAIKNSEEKSSPKSDFALRQSFEKELVLADNAGTLHYNPGDFEDFKRCAGEAAVILGEEMPRDWREWDSFIGRAVRVQIDTRAKARHDALSAEWDAYHDRQRQEMNEAVSASQVGLAQRVDEMERKLDLILSKLGG